jgi:hypothetical protein
MLLTELFHRSSAGWANITGQITLVASIDLTCAQMITTAIAVASDNATVVSSGATYGILAAILFAHGIVSSAATSILARINLGYVLITGTQARIACTNTSLTHLYSWNIDSRHHSSSRCFRTE